jgi:hypothetical protein
MRWSINIGDFYIFFFMGMIMFTVLFERPINSFFLRMRRSILQPSLFNLVCLFKISLAVKRGCLEVTNSFFFFRRACIFASVRLKDFTDLFNSSGASLRREYNLKCL